MQDEDGQILEAHSISAGLDYPGAGPEHALPARHGPRALRGRHRRRGARRASARLARAGGHHPGARVRARDRLGARRAPAPADTVDLVCLSGRGDKDLAEVLAELGSMIGADTGLERIAAAFAAAPGRAALMPYLMGGFPTSRPRAASARPTRTAGADLVELGVPFSDPLADGPVIHAAGIARAARRRDAARRARGRPAASPSASRWCSCATPTRSWPAGSSASRRARRARGQRA